MQIINRENRTKDKLKVEMAFIGVNSNGILTIVVKDHLNPVEEILINFDKEETRRIVRFIKDMFK